VGAPKVSGGVSGDLRFARETRATRRRNDRCLWETRLAATPETSEESTTSSDVGIERGEEGKGVVGSST